MKYAIIVLVILAIAILLLYNYLVKMNIRCKNAWSQIDNQLKRRADLIPNLVEVTKGYASHESKTLVDVVNARNNMSSMSDLARNSEEVSKELNKLFALSEGYPDLKANEIFKNLQIELVGTEDKIAFARQFYNDTVQQFNTAITIFPNNLLAKMMKYIEKEYFKVLEDEKKTIKVNFE